MVSNCSGRSCKRIFLALSKVDAHLLLLYLNGAADGLAVQESVLGGQNGFQIEVVARQGVGLGQSKTVPLVFSIEAEGKT